MTSKEALEYISSNIHYWEPVCEEDCIKNTKVLYKLTKDLEILEILKNKIMLIENTQMTMGYGKYYLKIRPDVILNDDAIKMIKEWLDKN